MVGLDLWVDEAFHGPSNAGSIHNNKNALGRGPACSLPLRGRHPYIAGTVDTDRINNWIINEDDGSEIVTATTTSHSRDWHNLQRLQ